MTLFEIVSKRVKHPRLNLTKEVKEMYYNNYKILIKEIEGDTKKWIDITCSWFGRINIVKNSYQPKQSTY